MTVDKAGQWTVLKLSKKSKMDGNTRISVNDFFEMSSGKILGEKQHLAYIEKEKGNLKRNLFENLGLSGFD